MLDAERSRYFKIEGSGNAITSAYSNEAVKKRQARDLHEEAHLKKSKRDLVRIRRAVNRDATISGFTMSREHGARPDLDTPRRILAEGLVPGRLFDESEARWYSHWKIEPLFCVSC